MQNVKNTILDTALSLIAPHLCSGCGFTGSPLCDNCKKDINRRPASFNNSPNASYDALLIIGQRLGTLRRAIDEFKFQNVKALARELAKLLDSVLPALPHRTVLVPIPTIAPHVRERGYDHIHLLTAQLATYRGLPMEQLLTRATNSVQHYATRDQRIAQAAATFRVEEGARRAIRDGITYLLIDDIFTTGSTVEYAARALKRAGATEVRVVVLARQPLD
jgi:ComF family protein